VTLFQALLFGLLQGATEFFPVSSSGHLVLVEQFLRIPIDPLSLQGFDVLLHSGSLLALLVCYRTQWWRILRHDRRLLGLLLLATIPAGIAGFILQEVIAVEFRSVTSVAIAMLISAVILILGEQTASSAKLRSLSPFSALFVGIAQACALVPGLSRSGLTISAGRVAGLSREDALDFSFLLAVPVIAGATALTLLDLRTSVVDLPHSSVLLTGFFASLGASIATIELLRRFVQRASIAWFALYLIPAALILLAREWELPELWSTQNVHFWVRRYGAIGVFLFALLEALPPLSFFSPGVIGLVIAGALMGGAATALLFFVAAVGGVALGNMVFFLLGERYGRRFAQRLHIRQAHLANADHFMERFGTLSVFCGQFIGAVRPLVAFVAGTVHMPRRMFYPWMLSGGAVFSAGLLGFGYLFRAQLPWVLSVVGGGGLFMLLIVILTCFLVGKTVKKKPT